MNIRTATRQYENWLADQVPLDHADLTYKHQQMANRADPFPFFRATFYRWLQHWPEQCPELQDAPRVLAVGDLHVENFGTWRDIDGRLVWGVNDFDEAAELPYTNDLVRLAVSVRLALRHVPLRFKLTRVCREILAGYRKALRRGGRAFILEEEHPNLRAIAMGESRDPVRFWRRMSKLLEQRTPKVPDEVRKGLLLDLPDHKLPIEIRRRPRAGLGSLGKPRFVGIAEWAGGLIAREAKAVTLSASAWIAGDGDAYPVRVTEIAKRAVRCPDPYFRLEGDWVLRRLAPHCSRIELSHLTRIGDEARLLRAMGWETANIHLGSPNRVPRILADLEQRPQGWLVAAAKQMAKAIRKDWREWCAAHSRQARSRRSRGQ
jgi:uncharacterized protein (DUF2252 family)